MDRESFLDGIKQQYAERIHEAYIECEHEEVVDFTRLGTALKKLMTQAKAEGLPAKDFEDLVRSTLPESVEHLNMFARAA
jgi:hypothetical protein